jgi:vanillate/3-O-methylgallate O-demethylase
MPSSRRRHRKTATERHRQAEIRVSPVPYARQARESYAAGSWRARSA